MQTICIQADDDLLTGLARIAKDRSATIEATIGDVLKQYLQNNVYQPPKIFIYRHSS